MNFEEWEPLYQQILTDFGFDRSEDERSAEILAGLIKSKDLIEDKALAEIINSKNVFVFGAGPSLGQDLSVDDFQEEYDGVTIAADGATSVFVKNKIIPDIIVTDLDGRIEDQISANDQGSIVIIHAHGDNIEAIKKWAPKFNKKLLGTTQSKPIMNIHNYGGFTDGDRAVFLAAHFKAKKIFLVAFDFEEPGEHSYKFDLKTKLKKLTWANGLIGMVMTPDVVFKPPPQL